MTAVHALAYDLLLSYKVEGKQNTKSFLFFVVASGLRLFLWLGITPGYFLLILGRILRRR